MMPMFINRDVYLFIDFQLQIRINDVSINYFYEDIKYYNALNVETVVNSHAQFNSSYVIYIEKI